MAANLRRRLLSFCSELYPLVKTGGLADVCAALPRALVHEGVDVSLMLPAYPSVLAGVENPQEVFRLPGGGRILRGCMPDSHLTIYLFDEPDLFCRPGGPYQDASHRDWPDNHRRFAVFCRAAAALAVHGDAEGWVPDVVHAHTTGTQRWCLP